MNMKNTITLICLFFTSSLSIAQVGFPDFEYFQKTEYHAVTAHSNKLENGVVFEKIIIDGFDARVPFYFIRNESSNKFVILLHGLTASKDHWIYPMTPLSEKYVKLKDSLLVLGFNIIIPDAKYHGERSHEANFISPVKFAQDQDIQSSYNLYSTTVKDIRIIMDYIQLSHENDSLTFNIIGYSMGGMITILLNAVENRVARTVVCVAPLDMKKSGIRLGFKEENAEKLDRISPKHFAPLQKAPVTYLVGTKDGWYTKDEAQAFFDEIVVEDKTIKFYESGHFLPESFTDDAIEGIVNQ